MNERLALNRAYEGQAERAINAVLEEQVAGAHVSIVQYRAAANAVVFKLSFTQHVDMQLTTQQLADVDYLKSIATETSAAADEMRKAILQRLGVDLDAEADTFTLLPEEDSDAEA